MQKGVRRIVVNADDFGYGAERDRGIIEAYLKGVISGASVISSPFKIINLNH